MGRYFMGFQKSERSRIVALRDALFSDPGNGVFSGKPREFVLADPKKNLIEMIRGDALTYFAKNSISWWKGAAGMPTGHLLSSQVACVNLLFPIRHRAEVATAILRAIDPDIERAEIVDDGYVEFEFIGKCPRLMEKAFSRGANCTSVDAFMIGSTRIGGRRAFLIEWKYTEHYDGKYLHIPARAKVYDPLLAAEGSPFHPHAIGAFYHEPFYQLMRQTLLGWLISKHGDYGCTSYRHVHVAPSENLKFHGKVTARKLTGQTISEAWKSALRCPNHYISTTPAEFLRPITEASEFSNLASYLAARYWAADRGPALSSPS